MPASLWKTGTINAFASTLNGSITANDTTINLTTTTGLIAPGVLCIDRQDGSENNTPNAREYVSFTGIAGNAVTGVTRGVAGSTAQAHASGAMIEENFSTSHWNDLVTFLQVGHDSAGGHVISTATIANLVITNSIVASGASVLGSFPIHPVWVVGGLVSLATTAVGKPLPVPQAGTLTFFSATTRTPASGATLVLDVNKNFTSVFTEQAHRPMIPGGGTFVSTASIAIKAFNSGDIFSMDIDQGGGTASDLTVVGRG